MTSNQIAASEAAETKRHNLVMESYSERQTQVNEKAQRWEQEYQQSMLQYQINHDAWSKRLAEYDAGIKKYNAHAVAEYQRRMADNEEWRNHLQRTKQDQDYIIQQWSNQIKQQQQAEVERYNKFLENSITYQNELRSTEITNQQQHFIAQDLYNRNALDESIRHNKAMETNQIILGNQQYTYNMRGIDYRYNELNHQKNVLSFEQYKYDRMEGVNKSKTRAQAIESWTRSLRNAVDVFNPFN